ncbi:MAG: hypothetical protein Q9218_007127 [Villophora microphyllina]
MEKVKDQHTSTDTTTAAVLDRTVQTSNQSAAEDIVTPNPDPKLFSRPSDKTDGTISVARHKGEQLAEPSPKQPLDLKTFKFTTPSGEQSFTFPRLQTISDTNTVIRDLTKWFSKAGISTPAVPPEKQVFTFPRPPFGGSLNEFIRDEGKLHPDQIAPTLGVPSEKRIFTFGSLQPIEKTRSESSDSQMFALSVDFKKQNLIDPSPYLTEDQMQNAQGPKVPIFGGGPMQWSHLFPPPKFTEHALAVAQTKKKPPSFWSDTFTLIVGSKNQISAVDGATLKDSPVLTRMCENIIFDTRIHLPNEDPNEIRNIIRFLKTGAFMPQYCPRNDTTRRPENAWAFARNYIAADKYGIDGMKDVIAQLLLRLWHHMRDIENWLFIADFIYKAVPNAVRNRYFATVLRISIGQIAEVTFVGGRTEEERKEMLKKLDGWMRMGGQLAIDISLALKAGMLEEMETQRMGREGAKKKLKESEERVERLERELEATRQGNGSRGQLEEANSEA